MNSYLSASLTLTAFLLVSSLVAAPANAEIYKCVVAGKTTYANEPCSKDAKPAALKGNVTVMERKHFVGQEKTKEGAPAGKTALGIKVPNPVAECKAKGGTIDKELRACMLP
jgi:Domain of unknown function (DUF4124)